MANRPEEISDSDLERMYEGLEADLKEPGRIRLMQIEDEIAGLRHRSEYAAESFELSGINAEISALEEEKSRLLSGDKGQV